MVQHLFTACRHIVVILLIRKNTCWLASLSLSHGSLMVRFADDDAYKVYLFMEPLVLYSFLKENEYPALQLQQQLSSFFSVLCIWLWNKKPHAQKVQM